MKNIIFLTILIFNFFLTPAGVALAASRDIQWYLITIRDFFNYTLVPFLFAIALLFFFVNVTRYFIIDAADTSSRETARNYAIYSIIAFVFLFSIWGIIGLIINSLGIGESIPICPDYFSDCGDAYYND